MGDGIVQDLHKRSETFKALFVILVGYQTAHPAERPVEAFHRRRLPGLLGDDLQEGVLPEFRLGQHAVDFHDAVVNILNFRIYFALDDKDAL